MSSTGIPRREALKRVGIGTGAVLAGSAGTASAGYDVSVHPVKTSYVASDGAEENRSAVSKFAQQLRDRCGLSVAELSQKTVDKSKFSDSDGDGNLEDGEMCRQTADILYDRGELEHHDHILLAHTEEYEGFGVALGYEYNPENAPDWFTVSVGTHLIDPVGDALAETIGIQELLHTPPGKFDHCHGQYWMNSSDDIYLVSPLAAAYTFETYGSDSCDSEHCGATFCATDGPYADGTPDKFVGPVNYGDVGTTDCSNIYHTDTLDSPYTSGNFVSDCPLHTKYFSDFVVSYINQTGAYDNWSSR